MIPILKAGTEVTAQMIRLIETKNGFYINNQYYNKDLSPVAQSLSGQIHGYWPFMNLNKTCMNNLYAGKRFISQGFNNNNSLIVRDNNNSEICYLFNTSYYYSPVEDGWNTGNSSEIGTILKIRETDTEAIIVKKGSPPTNYTKASGSGLGSNYDSAISFQYGVPIQYLGQNNTYIFMLQCIQGGVSEACNNSTGGAGDDNYCFRYGGLKVLRINKEDLTWAISDMIRTPNNGAIHQGGTGKLLYENTDFIYFVFGSPNGMSICIMKFNKNNFNLTYGQTNTVVNKANNGWFQLYYKSYVSDGWTAKAGYYPRKIFSNVIQKDETHIILYDLMYRDATKEYSLEEITIDLANEDYTQQVTYRNLLFPETIDLFMFPAVYSQYTPYFIEQFVKQENGDIFFNMSLYYAGNNSSRPATTYVSGQGIHTIKITETGLQYMGKTVISNAINYGILYSNDKSFCIVPTQTSFVIMNWDSVEKKYKKSSEINNSFYSISLDMNDNIIVTSVDGTVSLYNANSPTDVYLTAPQATYQYQNEDIPVDLTLICRNYDGTRIASTFEITIDGNAKFNATNNKKIKVTTTSSSDLIIPITIVGEGAITFYPKIIFS